MPLTTFYLFGVFITFFLATVLLTKRNKVRADHIFIAWLFFLCIHLTLFYLVQSGKYTGLSFLLGLEIPLPLVHGPFLYLYTLAHTNQFPRKHTWIGHFIPTIVVYLLLSWFFLLPAAEKVYVYEHAGGRYDHIRQYIYLLIIASGVLYIVLTLLLLRRHQKRMLYQYSATEQVNLNWLRYLTLLLGLIWISVITGPEQLIFMLVVCLVLFIGYFGIRQVGILNDLPVGPSTVLPLPYQPAAVEQIIIPEADKISIEPEPVKYQKSGITPDDVVQLYERLQERMQRDKIFTDPELTLGQLAGLLQVNANTLSQVINSVEHKNFYDYINTLRIEEFKQRVADPDNRRFTILSLAFDCGFNSKTAFNRNFKKITGLSPTAYIDRLE